MQFLDNGCDNCVGQSMMGDSDRVLECTTNDFQGLITVLNPGSSWTARWLHVGELPQLLVVCSTMYGMHLPHLRKSGSMLLVCSPFLQAAMYHSLHILVLRMFMHSQVQGGRC